MNNKQKREYLNGLRLSENEVFSAEVPLRNKFLKSIPKTLFKYRPFDKYAWEMIGEGYAFLSPTTKLDDPFDCLNISGLEGFFDKKRNRVTSKGLDFIIDYFVKGEEVGGISKSEIKRIAKRSMTNTGVEAEEFAKLAAKVSGRPDNDLIVLIFLKTINEFFASFFKDGTMDAYAKTALFPQDGLRVCSLSETRDNKVMWSLYGKTYEGYCIEYEIPRKKNIVRSLYPVIYTKRTNNSFVEKTFKSLISSALRLCTSGRYGDQDLGSLSELFCTKHSDWSYQKEWRLLAIDTKYVPLVAKAVYLGFRVAKTNEKRMLRLAKKKGFSLFKMNPPDGTKRITYQCVFCPDKKE